METSFLVHNVQLSAYLDADLDWTSFPHMYGKYTENVKVRAVMLFFLPWMYGQEKAIP